MSGIEQLNPAAKNQFAEPGWYDLGLGVDYPLLTDGTALAAAGIDLKLSTIGAFADLGEVEAHINAGLPVAGNRIIHASDAHELALNRMEVYAAMYRSMKLAIYFPYEGTVPTYENMVGATCDIVHHKVHERFYRSLNKQRNLRELTQRLGQIYLSEEDSHFKHKTRT
jgi:hypothetical protein